MENEQTKWNQRYRNGSYQMLEPDQFLEQAYRDYLAPFFPRGGEALDVAGGIGRHALWLSEHGWRVTLTDISEEGIQQAQARDGTHSIEFIHGDARDLEFGRARFDLVMVFFYLEREIFPKLKAAIRPGGMVLYKTLTREQPRETGPHNPMHLLESNELLHAFADFRILHYREILEAPSMAELVAQKRQA